MNTEMRPTPTGTGLWTSDALKYIGRLAMELHRYRYIRTRVLHDSLNRIDGGDNRERNDGNRISR